MIVHMQAIVGRWDQAQMPIAHWSEPEQRLLFFKLPNRCCVDDCKKRSVAGLPCWASEHAS